MLPLAFPMALALLPGLYLSQPPARCGAGVYKWTDEHGQTNYGDRPPAAGKIQSLGVAPTPPPPVKSPYVNLIEEQRRQEARESRERIERMRELQREEDRSRLETARNQEKCRHYRRKAEDVQEKLREGSAVKKAARLHRQLAGYEEEVKNYCR
jgi:uncharacterized protein DUF4124